jgi:hypothetical protein
MGRIMLKFGFTESEIDSIKSDSKDAVADAFERCKSLPSADMGEVLEKEKSVVNRMWGRRG